MDTSAFFRFAPSPALAPFIEVIRGVREYASFTREAVLPDGAVEPTMSLDPVQRVHA